MDKALFSWMSFMSLPIPFIVGVPRSGTTLLRLMLDAHPQLAIPPETHFIPGACKRCRNSAHPAKSFMEFLSSHPRWNDWHVDKSTLASAVHSLDPFDTRLAINAFYRIYANRFHKPGWGDKTPGYLLHMPLIYGLFPEAHFIHVIRDCRDVYLSVKDMWWGPDTPDKTALWWKDRICQARKDASAIPHYLEIRFDDLVLAPEKTLDKICGFLELKPHTDMLKYYVSAQERISELGESVVRGKRKATAQKHREIFRLTSKPPQKSRLGRWKKELDRAQNFIFLQYAGDLLKELGYEHSF
jgi:hypothetical protein